jgi:DNA-binding CsgD family transcriptional regulator
MSQGSYPGPERRAQPRSGNAPLLAAALDEVDHGLLVVRQDLSVVFANHAARKVLSEGASLRLFGGFLVPAADDERGDLLAALKAAATKQVRSLVRLGLVDGEATYDLSVTPLHGSMHGLAGPGACLLKLGRTVMVQDLSVVAFARQLGLSPREREVLTALCHGQRPADIAQSLGLSLATVRTHVHNLRRKAKVPNVMALIRKVASVPSLEQALKLPTDGVR